MDNSICGTIFEKLISSVELFSAGLWQWNLEQDSVVFNTQCSVVFGMAKNQFPKTREQWNQYIHPEDRNKIIKNITSSIYKEGSYKVCYKIQSPNEETHWILERGKVFEKTAQNKPLIVAGTIRDITDSKKTEMTLLESEARLQAIIENLPVAFCLRNPAGKIIMQNQVSTALWGHCINQTIEEQNTSASTRALWMSHIARALAGEIVDTEVSLDYLSGSGIFRSVVAPVKRDNETLGIVELDIDITHRKKAEEALRHSEENLHITLNSIADAVVATDGIGIITRMNPVAERILGCSLDDTRGSYLPDIVRFIDRESRDPLTNPIHSILEHESVIAEETVARLKIVKGDDKLVAFTCAPIKNANAITVGAVLVFRDITEQIHAEQRVKQQDKLETLGRLAGCVAHDLNNLLTPLLGFSEILLINLNPNDSNYNMVEKIRSSAQNAQDVSQQLLAFSHRQPLEVKKTDIADCVNNCMSILHRIVREDVQLNLTIEHSPAYALVDISQIEQVLVNLIVFCQDSLPSGGEINITIGIIDSPNDLAWLPKLESKPYITIQINDSSEGIEQEVLDRLFEPYFSTGTIQPGSGLGMATVYGIMRKHGGHIAVKGEIGQGTTFSVYLPEAPSEDLSANKTPVLRRGPKGQETIYVVEDDEIVRDLTCRILQEHGYNVLQANGPEQCLSMFPSVCKDVDLLLTDVIMPNMNGKQLYKTLSQSYPNLRVLYMTGYTDSITAQHGVLEEGTNILQKPFSLLALTSKVRIVLDE